MATQLGQPNHEMVGRMASAILTLSKGGLMLPDKSLICMSDLTKPIYYIYPTFALHNAAMHPKPHEERYCDIVKENESSGHRSPNPPLFFMAHTKSFFAPAYNRWLGGVLCRSSRDRQTQTDRQTDRQTDGETDRHTDACQPQIPITLPDHTREGERAVGVGHCQHQLRWVAGFIIEVESR